MKQRPRKQFVPPKRPATYTRLHQLPQERMPQTFLAPVMDRGENWSTTRAGTSWSLTLNS